MAVVAPDTNPDVVPTPVKKQGSLWVLLGAALGFLAEHFDLIPLPDGLRPYAPVIAAFIGWAAHQRWGPDEYEPAPTPERVEHSPPPSDGLPA